MARSLSDVQLQEIEAVCSRNGGYLTAEAVVANATPRTSSLHGLFEWDDRKAGHEYRLNQARVLIGQIKPPRVTEVVMPPVIYVRDPLLTDTPSYRASDSPEAQANSIAICLHYLGRSIAALSRAETVAGALGCDWPITAAVDQIKEYANQLESRL